jgi:phosphotransferase system HPr (HPr) family protein
MSPGKPPQSGQDAMSGEPLRRKITITNLQGLHLRPITSFVELANRYQSSVHVQKEGQERISGKSALNLLGLGAEQGTELTLETCGPDQEEAMAALVAFLNGLAALEDGAQAN